MSHRKDQPIGPMLPNTKQESSPVIGPVLPQNSTLDFTENDSNSSDDCYGPALPPEMISAKKRPILGPATLPSELNNSDDDDDDDDDMMIGPAPPGEVDKNHQYDGQLRIKSSSSKKTAREQWMLEPPKVLSGPLSLPTKSVSQFSQKGSKNRKPLTEEEKQEININEEKDNKMKEFLDKYEKTSNKRSTSLLEQHREQIQKTKKPKLEKLERKEFDRDRDLCAPRMDSKLKNQFIKEASSFGDRFSSGRFQKFL